MNGLSRFLAVTIAVIAVSGCAPPIGNIDGSGERLVAVPSRVSYDVNDLFLRREHLKVFTSYRGAMQLVSIDLVTIGIAEDPDQPDVQTIVPPDGVYPFTSPGRKLVIITYNKLSTRYWIEVDKNPYGLEGPDNGNGNNGTGINVEWWDE